MDISSILLETLTKKDSSIIDFWETKQKEIGISKLEFWVQLNKSIDFYYNEIEKKSKKKNLPKTESLKKLETPLLKWANENNILIYYYDYNHSNVIFVNNSSLWKKYESLKNFNNFSFTYELKNKPAEQIPEFLDFHLRNFKRKYEKFSSWNELHAEWFRHTKRRIPATFTPQQKDKYLTWFENQYEISKEKEKGKVKYEIVAEAFALFCRIVHWSGTIERGFNESSQKYCKRVITHFELNGNSEKIRGFFKIAEPEIIESDKYLQQVIKVILPKLVNPKEKDNIQKYITNKIKLYG